MLFEVLIILSVPGVIAAILAIMHDRKKRQKAQQNWEHFQKTGNLKNR